jgi:hypothetical protein
VQHFLSSVAPGYLMTDRDEIAELMDDLRENEFQRTQFLTSSGPCL